MCVSIVYYLYIRLFLMKTSTTENTTMNNKTALQIANELRESNSAIRAWDIANGHIPSICAGDPFSKAARFWQAVAHWIALGEMRKSNAGVKP